MIRYIKLLGGLLLAGALVACGGGGGSPGATSTGGGTTGSGSTSTTVTPTLVLSVQDSSGAALSGNAIAPTAIAYAVAKVTDSTGAVVTNKLVTFTARTGVVTFQPTSGQVLTDSSGVAKVQVTPSSIQSAGADTITASATLDASTAVTASIDVQTSPVNVALSNFAATQGSLTAFQSTGVSVDVSVNGAAATSTPVTVSFSSNCGTFSPASIATNSAGKAVSTFQATGCSGGTATLTAAAPRANSVQTSVVVQPPQATNLLFVSATPPTIYTSGATSGVKQSTVLFKVVDASGASIGAGQRVLVSLSSFAVNAGVVFADTNSAASQTLTTDANGQVSVIVKSGAFPTPLAINAQLVSNPAITGSSAGLSVDSGRAVQNFFSIAAAPFNIEGWQYDGELAQISVRVADRLGQPVPAGTPVSFITEGGQVTASCLTVLDSNNKSGCTVSLASQNFRPSNGRVTVLAYMDGDEVFIDANGNNRYDAGEIFFDMGQPFLDSNENGLLELGEQRVGDPTVAGSGVGTQPCLAHQFQVANVANTCDNTWGPTRVRGQLVIVFSTSFANTSGAIIAADQTGVLVMLRDQNGNAMPFGTTVTASVSGGTSCSVVEVVPSSVASGTDPSFHRVSLTAGTTGSSGSTTGTCKGAAVTIKATTPKNNQTLLGVVTIP